MTGRRPKAHQYNPAILPHDQLTRPQLTWILAGAHATLLHAPALNEYETDMLTRRGTLMDGETLCGVNLETVDMPGPRSERTVLRCTNCCKVTGYPVGVGSPYLDAKLRVMLRLDRPPIEEKVQAIRELCAEWIPKAFDPTSDDYAIGRSDMAGAIMSLLEPSAEVELLKAS